MVTQRQVGFYFVLFLDVLGQREKLRSVKALPTSQGEIDIAASTINQALDEVASLRADFEHFFQVMNTESPYMNTLSSAAIESVRQHSMQQIRSYGFSDSFVVYAPLRTEDDNCTSMNGVRCAILAACSVMIWAMSKRIVLRGGIDVGLATLLSDVEVYGPVLERAYCLESRKADFPRIVVGEELLRYLSTIKDQPRTTTFGHAASVSAEQCLSMISVDADGSGILDYVGLSFWKIGGKALGLQKIQEVLAFAETEKNRFHEIKNQKLEDRYIRLCSYLRDRTSLINEE